MTPVQKHRLALGSLLYQLRTHQGVTQTDLARRANVSQPTVSRTERGRKGTQVFELAALAQALGTSLGPLLSSVDVILADAKRVADAIKPGSFERLDVTGVIVFATAHALKEKLVLSP